MRLPAPPLSLTASLLSLLMVGLGAGSARAQGLHHVDPERESEVPLAGGPTWIENLTVGSPLADHGSHAGLKASVTADAPIAARAFLNMAHYGGFQVVGAQVDQSLVYVVEGGQARLAPPADRRIEFHPWGWEEVASGDGLDCRGAVTTLATDAFLVTARIVNRGAAARTLAPRLALVADGDGIHEGMHPLHLSWVKRWSTSLDQGRGAARIKFRRGTILETFAWDRQRLVRLIKSDIPIRRVRSGLQPFANAGRWACTLELEERTVAPGAALTVSFLIACGADQQEAERISDAQQGALADGPAALNGVRAAWDRDLRGLPNPHETDTPQGPGVDERHLWNLAYTGMRMNRYAPRGQLTGTLNTASKIHFNAFFVWDVPIAALAESNWDPALSREMLQELFRAQMPEGHLHYAVDERHQPVNGLIRGTSQPPVHGWVAERVLERGGLDRAWLDDIYTRSQAYLEWFARKRDSDGDGSFGFANALETGWDDTPRYPGLHPAPEINLFGLRVVLGNLSGLLPVDSVEALDLNCWLVSYYRAMARWAEELGKPAAEAQAWRDRADALARKVDADMWDPQTGTYRDVRARNGVNEPVRVDTPVVAWPLFQGVSRDPARVRATIERYLLDPTRAFGDPDAADPRFPVPSVAWDDPTYDRQNDGYYWRGQSWLVPAYAACEALYKYGWEADSRELRRRILRGVVNAHANGIYETYDSRSNRIGFGSGSLTGAGEPAAFLIGLSCAPVVELLLDRQERERLVGAAEPALSGYVYQARELESDRLLYQVAYDGRGLLPRSELRTRDGAPLRAPTARGLELVLSDPPLNMAPQGTSRVTLPGKGAWTAWDLGTSPARQLSAPAGPDLALDLPLGRFALLPPGAPPP